MASRAKRQEKIQDTKERILKLQAEVRKLENREKAERKKLETRRKILAGSYLLHLIETGNFPQATFREGMDDFLTRAGDRELFGLNTGG